MDGTPYLNKASETAGSLSLEEWVGGNEESWQVPPKYESGANGAVLFRSLMFDIVWKPRRRD